MDTSKFGSFVIDEKQYLVGYNGNNLCDMEDAAGCNLLEGMGNLNGGTPSFRQLRGLLAAMIVAPSGWPVDPKKQLDYAGNLIRIDTSGPIIVAIAEACFLAISEETGQRFRDSMAKAAQDAMQQAQDDAGAADAGAAVPNHPPAPQSAGGATAALDGIPEVPVGAV